VKEVSDEQDKKPMPLTDEELSRLWHEAKEQPFRFARLIEQAHGVRGRR
jgi:hypothetical protein